MKGYMIVSMTVGLLTAVPWLLQAEQTAKLGLSGVALIEDPGGDVAAPQSADLDGGLPGQPADRMSGAEHVPSRALSGESLRSVGDPGEVAFLQYFGHDAQDRGLVVRYDGLAASEHAPTVATIWQQIKPAAGAGGPCKCTGSKVAVQISRSDQRAEDRYTCAGLLPATLWVADEGAAERALFSACAVIASKRRRIAIWDPDPARSSFLCVCPPPDSCE